MIQVINVDIAQQCVTTHPNKLSCSAMGACVAVCLADRQIGMIGVSHVMLPIKNSSGGFVSPAKYAHTAVEHLMNDMVAHGAQKSRIVAKLVGGATLYPDDVTCLNSSIGQRNIASACTELSKLGIPMLSCDIGGDYGRSIEVSADTFDIEVKTLSRGVSII